MTTWAESTLPLPLSESEARLRQIADTLPTYIAYVDRDLRYRMANRMYEQQFGRAPGEILGHDVAEIVGAAFPTIEAHLRAALGGETRTFETRMRTVDGDRFLDVSHIPDFDPEGRVRGVIVHGLDVTDRRRAEEALRGHEARQTVILNLLRSQRDATDPAAIMTAAAEAVGPFLRTDRTGFFEVLDADGPEATLQFGAGWSSGALPVLTGHFPARGVGERYLAEVRAGITMGIDDTLFDPFTANTELAAIGTRACIGAPMLREGRWRAGLYVHQAQKRSWTADEVSFVREVAEQTWDAVERVRARQAVRQSDERLRMALQAASGVGTWDWDVVTDRVYADEGFARLYRVDVEQARAGIGIQEFQRNIHPEDLPRVARSIEQALQTGEEFHSEYRLVQPGGSSWWVSAVGRCTYGPDGRPVRFPGIAFDITRRKEIEETLRASEERLRIAADTARLGTWELDMTTGRMVCSAICKQNFGRPQDVAFDYDDLIASIHPEDLLGMQMAVQAAMEGDAAYRTEYRAIWPDESVHWILASGRLVSGEDGASTKMVGVTLDVTERHHATQALMQSEKLAAVGRLASSIAHEINNPLESVMNLIYLAQQEAVNPVVKGYLDTADQELRRVSNIANQTLRFHKQSTAPRHTSCEELIESVLSIYQGRFVNSGVAIEKRKRAQHPVLCFDGEIRQVLNNLVGNAIDAMPKGGRLLIRSREGTAWQTGRRGLILTFADTGGGMSAATIQRIFDPFFTTKGIGGTGLGLWVSQEIVTRHRGTLRVRSRQQTGAGLHGTVFALFLPFDGLEAPVGLKTPASGDESQLETA